MIKKNFCFRILTTAKLLNDLFRFVKIVNTRKKMHISLVVTAVFALIAAIVVVSTLLLNFIKAVTEPKHSGEEK